MLNPYQTPRHSGEPRLAKSSAAWREKLGCFAQMVLATVTILLLMALLLMAVWPLSSAALLLAMATEGRPSTYDIIGMVALVIAGGAALWLLVYYVLWVFYL